MPMYMTTFAYTADAWKNLISNPEDRGKAVKKLVEGLGGRMIGLYYTMGDYDGFVITEAPDDLAAGAASMAAVAGGHLKAVRTTKLFTMKDAMEMMSRAGSVVLPTPQG